MIVSHNASAAGSHRAKHQVRYVFEVVIGKKFEYVKDLKKRMTALDISQGALARELKLTASQVSRWFTDNKERRVEPSMQTVAEIEVALVKIQEKRKKAQDTLS